MRSHAASASSTRSSISFRTCRSQRIFFSTTCRREPFCLGVPCVLRSSTGARSTIGHRITVLRDGRLVATHAIADVTVPELVRMMANRDLAEHFPKIVGSRGPELLRVEHVNTSVLSDVTLSLHAGEVIGIGGLLGA